MKLRRLRSGPLLALVALAPLASAQEPPATVVPSPSLPPTSPAAEDGPDLNAEQRGFLRGLATLNDRQLRLANEASGRATRADVRDYAAWLVREHTAFAEDLATLAKSLGDPTAAQAAPEPRAERPAWANEDDDDYDEGFVGACTETLGQILEKLETVRESPQTAVAAFARKHLTGVKSRRERASDLKAEI